MFKNILITAFLFIPFLLISDEIAGSYDEIIESGKKYQKDNNFIEAEKYFLTALKKMQKNKIENKELGDLYFNMGSLYSQSGNYNKAVIYFLLAIENREKNNMNTYDMKKNIAIAYGQKGNYIDSIRYFKESIKEARTNKVVESEMADIYYNYALVLLDIGKTNEALRYFELISRKYKNENFNSVLMSSVYNILGLAYFTNHNFIKAFENYKLSLGLLKDDKNNYPVKAKIYENLSKIYFINDDSESALMNLELSVKYYELSKIKDKQLALNYYTIALSNLKQNNIDKSLLNYNKALAIINELNITGVIAFHTYENTGSLYLNIYKDLDKAFFYYDKAEKEIDATFDSEIIANLYSNLSVLFYHKKEYDTVKKYLNLAIEEYKKSRNKEKINQMNKRLNDINNLL